MGVYCSLGTPCPGMTQAIPYLPGLPGRQGIIYLVLWAGFPGDPISHKDFGDGLGTSWWWLQLQSSQAFPYPLGKPNIAAWCSHLPFAMHRFPPTTMHTSALQSKSSCDLAFDRKQATAEGTFVLTCIAMVSSQGCQTMSMVLEDGSPVEQERQAFSGCVTQQNWF